MPAKSKAQARFMRLVRKCQETGVCLSDKIEKAAESMTDKQAHYFAKTTDKQIERKHGKKKIPKKIKKEYQTFSEYFLVRESKNICQCPCKSCKIHKNCSKCTHENCQHEGCSCHDL